VDRAEAPEAEASWKAFDTPICKRSVLARVFAPDEVGWRLVHFIRHLPSLTPAEIAAMEQLNPKSE